jgi:hypothetical protein
MGGKRWKAVLRLNASVARGAVVPSAQKRLPAFSFPLPSRWLKLTPGAVDQTFRCEPCKSIVGLPSG